MKLSTLHVRHFKAFNYDYLRRFHKSSASLPWEMMEDGTWYPFVDVSMERDITTVVGANESGKSQVLDAIEIALGQRDVGRTDFCRYSRFFLVDEAKRLPDFGATLVDLSTEEVSKLTSILGVDDEAAPNAFTLIRRGTGKASVFFQRAGDWAEHPLKAEQARRVDAMLPRTFRLQSQLPLPNAVPLAFLAGDSDSPASTAKSRQRRAQLLSALATLGPSDFSDHKAVAANAPKLSKLFVDHAAPADQSTIDKYHLADDLLVRITGIDREHFSDLATTIAEERDGYVDGVEELINRALATKLNFRRWWTQDRNFQLRVTVRETDIAFIVQDRTGTHYSFSERSGGLGYYLSYFVQYLRHQPAADHSEILLMDEPDAFLSSQGQKDLLRIFDAFAHPEDGARGCQVVYVTHSPFLIDRNHAERIRVLEKGDGDEGTRVVADVGRNHYEPLRSAFGALVAETTFMGTCNLMVEGIGDQVLIAGMSRRLQASDAIPHTEYLDLNDLTIVPCGGASQIPYLAYLARGRDVEKPAVIVLLDGDEAGDSARKALRKGGAYRKRLVEDELVLQINQTQLGIASDRPDGPIEIEDLVPMEIAARAAELYAYDLLGIERDSLSFDHSDAELSGGILAAASGLLGNHLEEQRDIEKVGFARSVLSVVDGSRQIAHPVSAESIDVLESNFRKLCRHLGQMQRQAVRELSEVKISDRLARVRDGFLGDHQSPPAKADVQVLFEEIGHVLDDSLESEDIRSELRRLATTHELEIDSASPIADFPSLRDELNAIRYRSRLRSQEGELAAEAQPQTSA